MKKRPKKDFPEDGRTDFPTGSTKKPEEKFPVGIRTGPPKESTKKYEEEAPQLLTDEQIRELEDLHALPSDLLDEPS